MARIVSGDSIESMIADAENNLIQSGESADTAKWAVNYAVKRTRGVVNDITDDTVLQEKLFLENLPKALNSAKTWISKEKKALAK